eukprot:TRINITY_DN18716_c0_g1_i1.p1 TRINITY_DN18716_c0_g1~~TRINITY_DN18716_c0_g1_i1.p1  ORF type:complete len:208 (-),score=51.12 TRINITY_DN18716_c0_g1_i1:174-797(-)
MVAPSNMVYEVDANERFRVSFYGGPNHSFQILATVINKATNAQVSSGNYQWSRFVGKSYVPIQGAVTRCYASTADDLYTTLRFEYSGPESPVPFFVDVPSQYFVMDPEVHRLVDQYVNIGRASGISFNIANVGINPVTEGWSIVVAENLVELRHDNVVVRSYDSNAEVILSPKDATIFRIADNYLQTNSLRFRDVIVLTIRALLGHL